MNLNKLISAAAVVLMCSLAACFGGGGNSVASGTLTQADFDKLLVTSSAFTDMQSAQKTDETTLAKVALIGHVPGATAKTAAAGRSTMAVTQAVDTTDYGVCADMGQHVANSLPPNVSHDIVTGNPIDVFKQCTGTKYLVDTETGHIATIETIWFSQANCQGTAIEFEADGVFDRPTLQGGIVFKSPADGSVRWVKPLAPGAVATQLTSQSINNGGTCTNGTEQHIGYDAVTNSTDGTDGSGVPDGGVPNTYIYD